MIGIFGGSGFSKFLEGTKEEKIKTPYGEPSAAPVVGECRGKKVAFMPRHGIGHVLPPHKINYRANLWAFKELGVGAVLGPCAVGSLQSEIKPGDFLIIDQFVDRTWGRQDTFYEGPAVAHVSPADPYCPELSRLAAASCRRLGISVHPSGTVAVINGPRFSTKAESRWFSQLGWEIINMTQYPEAMLARELAMCYCGIALVTDYDAGLRGGKDAVPVDTAAVMSIFKQNNEKLSELLLEIISGLPAESFCSCRDSLKNAFIS